MAKVQSHRELIVWSKAMDLAVEVYRLSSAFPPAERYRLVDQVCRAAASVPANIAEGQGRGTSKDFAQFLAIARGSLNETETYLMLAIRLGYISQSQTDPMLSRDGDKQDAECPPPADCG
jgi:four helix bundle protein